MLSGEQPVVSVVILTKNSVSTIKKTLDSVFSQTRSPDEVVVVDGSSTDGTLDVVKSYPVKLAVEPGLGFGYARNLGVKEAKGDLIFFIDSDCYAEPQWIEAALPHFKKSEIAGVTGPTHLWNMENGVARFIAYVGDRINMPTQEHFVKTVPTMNLALRHQTILDVGGFDAKLVRGEDIDVTYKITRSKKILYEPKAVVWFKGSTNLKMASKKCINHFICAGQLYAKYGYDSAFERFNLLFRGAILFAAIISIFFAPWYVPTVLFAILVAEFLFKVSKAYIQNRDRCIIYYTFFFTFWTIVSVLVIYGFAKQKGMRKK